MIKTKIKDQLKIIILISFVLIILFSIGCNQIVEKVSSNISFNYPGLRLETLNIEKEDLKDKQPLIVCFGDSVTFGWNLKYEESYPFILETRLEKDYKDLKVINSGIGGNTTSDALNRLDRDVLSFDPDLVLINFGLNDGMFFEFAVSNDGNNFKFIENDETFYTRLSLETFRSNYLEILNELNKEDIKTVIMTTNPVLIDFPQGRSLEFRENQNEIYGIYNDEIRKISDQEQIPLVDIEKAFEKSTNLEELIQSDGIHPSSEGLEKIAEVIIDAEIIKHLLEK